MIKKRLLATILSILAFAATTLALWPALPLGRHLTAVGTAKAFAWRRPVATSRDITVVAIDDASIEAVGEWPWGRESIARLFEAPFDVSRLVVSAVSPGDFANAPQAARSYWKGLSQFENVAAAYPHDARGTRLAVVSLLSGTPAGGQATLVGENTGVSAKTLLERLPRWRSLGLRSAVRRFHDSHPANTVDDVLAYTLDPSWRTSLNVERLTRFWFAQAVSESAFLSGQAAYFPRMEQIEGLSEVDSLYLPSAQLLKAAPVGFAGAVSTHAPPVEAAVLRYRGIPLVRLGLAVGLDPRAVAAGAAVSDQFSFEPGGGIIVNWTGNASSRWNRTFNNIVPAAILIETANARRAAWQAYRAAEEALGAGEMAPLIDAFEQASASLDFDATVDAERAITVRMHQVRALLREKLPRRTPAEALPSPSDQGPQQVLFAALGQQMMSLDGDFQLLRNGLLSMFIDRIVVIAPTAARYRTMSTPWGRRVVPAALEVAILNSILTGNHIEKASTATVSALLAAGLLVALLAGRVGFLRAFAPALFVTALGYYGWFRLFDAHRILLAFSEVACLPAGFLGGALVHWHLFGRDRMRTKRVITGHAGKSFAAAAARRRGAMVLREVPGAAVLAVEMDAAGQDAQERCGNAVGEIVLKRAGILLDGAGAVEGAFGWLADRPSAADDAVSSALSAQRRLKLLVEKMRARGEGEVALYMGIGLGPGKLAIGIVSKNSLRASGNAFDAARRAARAARRFRIPLAVCAANLEDVRETYEVRKLDPDAEFLEILEKKGALSITAGEIRRLYEAALEAFAAGNTALAAEFLREALELAEDGPSRLLLNRIEQAPMRPPQA